MITWRLRKKNPDIFTIEGLFKRYYPRLFTFAFHLLENEEEAEDIVQDAFLIVCEQQSTIGVSDQAIKSYLYTTIKHDALNRLRHKKVIANFTEKSQQPEMDEMHVLDHLIHAEVIGELLEALEKLPEGCATICKMRYFEGLKNSQIADLLGISVHTVKSQKQRALNLLKKHLRPEVLSVFMLLLLK
ncbi:RNA polymerase sigma-70 factor [Olivibacter ginsenosidimutans]|uniref:RNA polymerase sigma-70 factor n=1 Tax=Olivibacter ginsenosidimutans TaxID=1176537 RepID=A0ABP9CAZ4_9SPHI